MPSLTIIAGPNGSGKSTLIRTSEFEGKENLLDVDAVAKRIGTKQEELAAAYMAAGREVLVQVHEYIQSGTSFSIETTLSGHTPLSALQEARASGFYTRLVYVCIDTPEVNILRVRERVASGGHNVADQDVRRRYARSLANLPRTVQLVHSAIGYDNTGRQLREIFLAEAGKITWLTTNRPQWSNVLSSK